MVRKFIMPQAIFTPSPDAVEIKIQAGDKLPQSDLNKITAHLKETGISDALAEIAKKFSKFLEKKLQYYGQNEIGETNPADNEYRSPKEVIESHLQYLSFVYMCKRTGLMQFIQKEEQDNSASERDSSSILISGILQEISSKLGEKQTAEIYKRLETITDNVFQKHFGRNGR